MRNNRNCSMLPNMSNLLRALVLLASLVLNSGSLKRVCPPQESLFPCTCKDSAKGLIVSCSGSYTDLNAVVSALQGYAIQQLSIVGAVLDSIYPDGFQGLHIEDLSISKLTVREPLDPKQRYLQGLENSLKTLEVSKSFKNHSLGTLRIDHLRHLEVMIMEDNEIQEITDDWFPGGPLSLNTLIFERNNIASVTRTAFSSLKNLRTFALAGNRISTLSRSMFPQPANHLAILDLASNEISSLPENLFVDMPALQNLNLDLNAISTLSESVMSPVWNQLTELSCLGNPFHCGSEIKWICSNYKISLSAECKSPSEAAGKHPRTVCS